MKEALESCPWPYARPEPKSEKPRSQSALTQLEDLRRELTRRGVMTVEEERLFRAALATVETEVRG